MSMNNILLPGVNPLFLNPGTGFNSFGSPIQGNPSVVYGTVNGVDGAKGFAVSPGKIGLLFDDCKNEFYWKTVDQMGMQTLKKFAYKEIDLPADSASVAESNRAEIEALNKKLSNMEVLLAQALQDKSGQKGTKEDRK